ncbi:MAG: PLP-dependent aminotransferase family protein [Yersiniaceae bacterium]|nr:PLP-dependent aminotransferase family protein [Yersiniaceae bacterium]
MTRYEELAQRLRRQIQSQVWLPGDKLPSLRESCKQSGLSLMTVLQAYQLLESQGWVVARPQSGYYVANSPSALPESGGALHLSEQVDINDAIFDILQAAKDPTIVPFGSAFPDASLFPQPRLARSLASAVRRMSASSAVANLPPGNEDLRRSIAQRYAQQGIAVAPDDIVITSGAMESLGLSLQAVTEPGDWVAIESPAFYGVLQAIERRQLKAVAIPTDVQTGIDLDALADALARYPIRACWLMSNFQNPLGATLPRARKQQLVAMLAARGIALIEDDVYSELYFGPARPPALRAFDRDGSTVLHCSSFSKCLAPGFRVGWVAAGPYAAKIQRLQLMSTLSASVPTQLALADYLHQSGFEPHLRRLRRQLELRQLAMYRGIQQTFPAGVSISRPEGGYFLWLTLGQGRDARTLYRRALAQGISIAPGHMFTTGDQFRDGVRLNSSFPWDARHQQAIETLGALVRGLL